MLPRAVAEEAVRVQPEPFLSPPRARKRPLPISRERKRQSSVKSSSLSPLGERAGVRGVFRQPLLVLSRGAAVFAPQVAQKVLEVLQDGRRAGKLGWGLG